MKTAYVLLQNGFADWEAASAMAELQRTFGFSVKTIGLIRGTIVSMGGLRVAPDLALAELAVESAAILILPGGDSWTRGEIPEVSRAVRAMLEIGRPVAAICAATLALAHCGLLNHHLHTSNGKDFIGHYVPEYRGQGLYRALPCVRPGCDYSEWIVAIRIRRRNLPRIGAGTRERRRNLCGALREGVG